MTKQPEGCLSWWLLSHCLSAFAALLVKSEAVEQQTVRSLCAQQQVLWQNLTCQNRHSAGSLNAKSLAAVVLANKD